MIRTIQALDVPAEHVEAQREDDLRPEIVVTRIDRGPPCPVIRYRCSLQKNIPSPRRVPSVRKIGEPRSRRASSMPLARPKQQPSCRFA